jgi:hypothetical protein
MGIKMTIQYHEFVKTEYGYLKRAGPNTGTFEEEAE